MSEQLPEEQRSYAQRAAMPYRVYVGRDALGGLMVYPHLPTHRQASQYMRVLTRQEVEELANSVGGVDTHQYLNSLLRTIEGQRKHIARLQEQLKEHSSLPDSIKEALNSGDGSYLP